MKSIIANAAFRGKSGSYLFGRGVRNATALGTRRYIQHKILNGSSFSSNCRILATLSPEQYFPFTSGQIIEKSSMKNISMLQKKSTRITSRSFSTATSDNDTFDINTIKGPHGSYAEEYKLSIEKPTEFWGKAADKLTWFKKPTVIGEYVDKEKKFYNWFSDGVQNTSYNCLDAWVEKGKGQQDAIIYDSPVTGVKKRYTYDELLSEVSKFAGVLQNNLGVEKGDRVVIYMPMIPEAAIAMLACTRIGAIHSVVFGGFASKELATRITDCQPKVIVSSSVGVEAGGKIVRYKPLLDDALEMAVHNVKRCVVVQRPNVENCDLKPDIDSDYEELMSQAQPVDAVPLPSTHPHYILYTSGTTGVPKGVIRDQGSWAVAIKYSMEAFYDTNPGEVMFTASDIGWAVGHSYTIYGPLLNGCTSIMYEGKPVGSPDAGAFWRVVDEYGVRSLFAAPTAFRAMKQADPYAEMAKKYEMEKFKYLFVAGEHCDPDTLHWCEKALAKRSIIPIDHWWQTELGWPGAGNAVGLGRFPVKYGACAAPVPGYEIDVVDDYGNSVPRGTLGDMVIKHPLPPGTMSTLYNNDQRYVDEYLTKYPGFYDTTDAAYIDDDGYLHIMGRTDDVINTAGHRLSTGAMEEILMDHEEVADCCVIKKKDELKGEVPVGFVVTKADSTVEKDVLRKELIAKVRESLGAVAVFKRVAVVKKLPKTRSGKILRGTMTKIANGEAYHVTPTVEDNTIFDYLEPEIRKVAAEEV